MKYHIPPGHVDNVVENMFSSTLLSLIHVCHVTGSAVKGTSKRSTPKQKQRQTRSSKKATNQDNNHQNGIDIHH